MVATRASSEASVVPQAPGTQPNTETKSLVRSRLLVCRTQEVLWAAEVVEVVEIAVAVEDLAISGVALDVAMTIQLLRCES